MTTHTPLIELRAARTAYRHAYEACPHWDDDGEFYGLSLYPCCEQLIAAEERLSKIKRQIKKQNTV